MSRPEPVLLFACEGVDRAAWLAALGRALPGVPIRVWPDAGDPLAITHMLLWKQPAALARQFPNLEAIFSMGAGVETLLADPDLPALPLIRMVDPSLAAAMAEYVALRVTHYRRRLPEMEANQQAGVWRPLMPLAFEQARVGILGMGELGRASARQLTGLGYDVAGWSRRPRSVAKVSMFSGAEGLGAFLARSDILVCLLPHTPQTEGILNSALFDQLPRDARLINVARGAHLVEADLVQALADGRLSHATLDTFREEPLPPAHLFWMHPRVRVTPHCSALTNPETAAEMLAENIRRLRDGRRPIGLVNRGRGY